MAEEVDPKGPSVNSTRVIDKFHSMPWLKICASVNKEDRKHEGNDGRFPRSKTDEDYFPGTKEEKLKKKKEKKRKVVLGIDELNDYMNLTNRKIPHVKECEESLANICHNEKKDKQKPLGSTFGNAAQAKTIWTTDSGAASKLFPNVNSVRIDRMEEEEMLSMALAESIITIELEQFNKVSPEKVQGRWKELYEDSDDGGWDNVRRNLPPADVDTGSYTEQDANNNKSLHNEPRLSGILRNKESYNSSLISNIPEFQFKRCSESSEEAVKTTRSGKSVAFSDSVSVKAASSDSSENDEHSEQLPKKSGNIPGRNINQPDIDKYGRIGGYSERRLFMGKGARMKEQLYLQEKCRLESSSQLVAQSKPALPCPKNLESKKSTNTPQESLTQKTTRITKKTQKDPKMTTKDSDAKIAHRTTIEPNILRRLNPTDENTKLILKSQLLLAKSSQSETSSKSLLKQNLGNESTMKSSVSQVTRAKLEPQKSVSKESPTQSKPQVSEMVEMTDKVVDKGKLMNEVPIEVKQDTCNETDLDSANKQKIDSEVEKPKITVTTNSLSIGGILHNENINNNVVPTEDSSRLVQNQNSTTNFSDIVNRMIDNDTTEITGPETETDSDTRCLVSVARGVHGCTSNTSATNPHYIEPPPAMVLAMKCPNPACQNLHLTGVVSRESFCSHLSYATEDYQNVQNFVNNNYPLQRLQPPLCSVSSNKLSPQTFSDINHGVSYVYPNIPSQQSSIQNTYSVNMNVPTHVNMLQYGNLAHSVPLQYSPYQNDDFFTESEKNVLSISGIPDLPSTPQHSESPLQMSAANDRPDAQANRAPPGFVKKLQLPPGFGRTSSPAQTPPLHIPYGKLPPQKTTSLKNTASKFKQQNEIGSQTGIGNQETAKPQTPEKRQAPYPILGASQIPDEVHMGAKPAKNQGASKSGSKKYKNIARSSMNNNYLSSDNPSAVSELYYRNTNGPLPNTMEYQDQSPYQSEVKTPVYHVPHVLDVQSNVDQNLRNENRNCNPYAEMGNPVTSQPIVQCQIIETDRYADYNMNEQCMGQFMPDVSAYPCVHESRAVPTAENTSNTPIFVEPRIGRGRGRLTQKDLL